MENTRILAVTLPVASVEGCTWSEFLGACHAAWAQSTALANWAVRQLAKADRERRSSDKKLWKSPKIYLYGLMKKYHDRDSWDGCAASANCILRHVEKKYAKTRLDTVWRGAASFPAMRYPLPYPIHNANWIPSYSADGRKSPLVQLRLPGQERLTLRLRAGHEFKRQLALFCQLAEGTAKRCEAAIYCTGAAGNTGRRKGVDRTPGGGQRRPFTVMLKLVGHFAAEERLPGDRTMTVSTDLGALWVAEVDGRQAWIYNGDEAKRWQAQHAVTIQRFFEDLKFERRWPKAKRLAMREALAKRCQKQRHRIGTFIDQATAMVTNYAARQRVGVLIYNDRVRDYMPSFPWYTLCDSLARKCSALGIMLKAASLDEKNEGE